MLPRKLNSNVTPDLHLVILDVFVRGILTMSPSRTDERIFFFPSEEVNSFQLATTQNSSFIGRLRRYNLAGVVTEVKEILACKLSEIVPLSQFCVRSLRGSSVCLSTNKFHFPVVLH